MIVLQRTEVNKENIEKKLQKKTFKGVDVEFRDKPASAASPTRVSQQHQVTSPAPSTPGTAQDTGKPGDQLRRTAKGDVPRSPMSGSRRSAVTAGDRQSLPPPPPTPVKSGRSPAPPPTGSVHAPSTAIYGNIENGLPPPPIPCGTAAPIYDNIRNELPPPPPVPTTPKPSSAVSGSGHSVPSNISEKHDSASDDVLPPPSTPPPLTESAVTKQRTKRLSRLTMPPPRMSVCIIDTSFDAVSETDELAMPPPPSNVMAPPPPPLPPPAEAALPPPPSMESGFALRAEPARQACQKKCESRGDLLAAIRKGQTPRLSLLNIVNNTTSVSLSSALD